MLIKKYVCHNVFLKRGEVKEHGHVSYVTVCIMKYNNNTNAFCIIKCTKVVNGSIE